MMRTPLAFVATVLVAGCVSIADRPAGNAVLDAYSRFNDTPREVDPKGYIGYLKAARFRGGELDSLPSCAIVLHDARTLAFVAGAGIDTTRVQRLVLGSSDPTTLFVVRRPPPAASFLITAGLPGAGGIATQTAELSALGTRAILHVGTAGLLGDAIPDSAVVVSRGSYKDGGAVLLSTSRRTRDLVARPDSALSRAVRGALGSTKGPVLEQTGFTIPIIYHQPSGLLRWLLEGQELAGERPAYVEMEQGSLFETAQLMGFKAASVIVGSDRYRITRDSLTHSFTDVAAEPAKQRVVTAVVAAFGGLSACR